MGQTFWQILQDKQIEIPEIQRDYAQGRNTPKAKAIREKFIDDILRACDPKQDSLDLDFIFGQSLGQDSLAQFEQNKDSLHQMLRVIENFSEQASIDFRYNIIDKPANQNSKQVLIPIDGQQRLTMLFLFHLYVGAQIGDPDLQKLQGFQYKTRKSSTTFIEKLTENPQLLKKEHIEAQSSPSEKLKDQPWFFNFWLKDPTVSGMLTVLDDIHNSTDKYTEEDFQHIWQQLTENNEKDENNSVKFDFFDIKEEGLEDDLYVKMNARGRSLSEFENFKAWLEKKHKNSNGINSSDWQQKLDKEWLDIFWTERINIDDVDNQYLSFFNHISLFKKLEQATVEGQQITDETKSLIQNLSSPDSEFPPTKYYDDKGVHDGTSVNEAFQLLELLSKEDRQELNAIVSEIWVDTFYNREEYPKFTDALLKGFRDLNLYHKTFIYAVLKYLLKKGKSPSSYSESDKNCLRVLRNIIYNSQIDDNPNYVRAIQALNAFIDEIGSDSSIYEFLKTQEKGKRWIDFFTQKQLDEEVKKASLDSEWQDKLFEAENHHYFYGQVGFILELSRKNDNHDIDLFQTYFTKLQNLFSKEHLDGEEYLIQRALLTVGDREARWMKKKSSNRSSFYRSIRGNSRNRDENWRFLFGHEERHVLKNLLDKSECTTAALRELIESGKKSIHDWRSHFIHEPKLLSYCKQNLINWNGEGEAHIRLLGQSQLNHYHCELRVKALYEYLIKDRLSEQQIELKPVRSGSEQSYICIKSNTEKDYHIRYNLADAFEYKLKDEEETEYREIEQGFFLFDEIKDFEKREYTKENQAN